MPQGTEGYITDVVDGRSIVFFYYDDVQDGAEPVYDESVVRGRSEEHLFYSHTSARKQQYNIQLAASVDQDDGGSAKHIWNDWLFILSLAYPVYGIDYKGPVVPPHKVILRIGKWIKHTGVIISPQATHSKTVDEDGFPLFINISFMFRIVNRKPLDLYRIRQLRYQTS